MVLGASLLAALLATAAALKPSPAGLGTHQQLGLPPCTLRVFLGVRCPSCGMTTAWSHLMHGHPVSAWRANAGGALLALVAAISTPWLFVSGLLGRWWPSAVSEFAVIGIGGGIVVIALVEWTVRLALGW